MGTTLASLLSIALASLAAGCGSQDGMDRQPYGGEVLVDHVRLPDGSDLRRLSAFFIAAQDPDVAPEVPLGQCQAGETASWQADARQYIDVGADVTFHLGDADFVVPRVEDAEDFFDRRHDIAYLLEVADVGEGFLMVEHTVTTAEPQSFSDQLRVLQPPVMQVDLPDGSAPLVVDRGRDLEISWTQSQPVDGLTVDITLIDDQTGAMSCRAADTGHFTVPADVFAGFASDTGTMIVASVSRAAAVTDAGRAIDVRAEYHGNLIPWQRR